MLITFDPEVVEMYMYKHKNDSRPISPPKLLLARAPVPQMTIHPHYISENVSLRAIGRETSDRVTQPVQRGINVDVSGTKIGKVEVFGDPAWYPRPVRDGGQRTPDVRRCGRPAHDNGSLRPNYLEAGIFARRQDVPKGR